MINISAMIPMTDIATASNYGRMKSVISFNGNITVIDIHKERLDRQTDR